MTDSKLKKIPQKLFFSEEYVRKTVHTESLEGDLTYIHESVLNAEKKIARLGGYMAALTQFDDIKTEVKRKELFDEAERKYEELKDSLKNFSGTEPDFQEPKNPPAESPAPLASPMPEGDVAWCVAEAKSLSGTPTMRSLIGSLMVAIERGRSKSLVEAKLQGRLEAFDELKSELASYHSFDEFVVCGGFEKLRNSHD